MKELALRYKDEVYRPGEDVSHLEFLSDAEKSDRRREIESIFADVDTHIAEQDARWAEADNQE